MQGEQEKLTQKKLDEATAEATQEVLQPSRRASSNASRPVSPCRPTNSS